MMPAETKPDMKRQLRSLISGIKSGAIRRLEGIGSKLNTTGLHQATFSGAIQSPVTAIISTPSLSVDYKDYYQKQSTSTPSISRFRANELSIHDIKDNVVPDNNQESNRNTFGTIGVDGKSLYIKVFADINPEIIGLQMATQPSDDLTCVGCGKRSNKEVCDA